MNESNKNLSGVLEYLNDTLRRLALKETEWLIQKNSFENKITELEGQLKASENINFDLMKRIKMLEYALCTERNKVLRLGGQVETDLKFKNSAYLNELEDTRELIKEEDLKRLKDSTCRPSLLKVLNDLGINENFANELFNDLEINKVEFEKMVKTNLETKSNMRNLESLSKNDTAITGNINNLLINNSNVNSTLINNNMDSSIISNSSINSVESIIKMNSKSTEEVIQTDQKGNFRFLQSAPSININFSNFVSLKSHFDVVRKLDYFPHLNTLVSVSEDCQIKLWSLKSVSFSKNEELEPYLSLRGHTGPLYSVAVSPDDSNILYTAGNEGIIKVWKIPKIDDVIPYGDTEEVSQNIGLMILNNEVIWEMKHHPVSNLLVSLSSDYNVNLWKTTNQSEYLQWMSDEKYNKGLIKTLSRKGETFTHGPNPTSCEFLSSDTNQLAIGFNDCMISVYDITKEKFSNNVKTHNLTKTINFNNSKDIYSLSHQQPNCITSNSTVPIIYSGFEDGSLKSIDLRNNEPNMITNSLNAHNDSVTSINIINNVYCVSTGHDGVVKLWDLRNYTCLHELSAHQNKFDESIWNSIFIQNYSYLATAGADSLIKLFKL